MREGPAETKKKPSTEYPGERIFHPYRCVQEPELVRSECEQCDFTFLLPSDMRKVAGSIDDSLPEAALVVENLGITLKVRDLRTVLPETDLCGEVINFYFRMLVHRGRSLCVRPRSYAFDAHFYPMLTEYNYEDVYKTWGGMVDIFKYDILHFPNA